MTDLSLAQVILGALTIASAVFVVAHRNPVVSAIMLMMTLLFTGGIYFSLGFEFIGAVQILIYAGAISVLFVFIVMLLDLKPSLAKLPGRPLAWALAVLAGVAMFAGFLFTSLQAVGPQMVTESDMAFASATAISLSFLSKSMLAFQVTGLLLLAAVMGVTVLGKSKRTESGIQQ